MMKKPCKTILSLVLTLAMLMSMSASAIFAANAEDAVPERYLYDLNSDEEGEDEKTPTYGPVTAKMDTSTLNLSVGEFSRLTVTVEGGSGNYEYEWSSDDKYVATVSGNGYSASVSAVDGGEAIITCRVYDSAAKDGATMTCKVSVYKPEPERDPLSLELSRGTIEMEMGGEAVIMAAADGGSGMYEYSWKSSNPNVVYLEDNGTSADIFGRNAGTATVTCQVYDGDDSISKSCTVIITENGGSTTYNISSSTTMGTQVDLYNVASEIQTAFKKEFGVSLDYSAVLSLDTTSNNFGRIVMQNSGAVLPGSNYQFSDLYAMMYFQPLSSGTFTTKYRVTDGDYIIMGVISITIKTAPSQDLTVSISKSSISLDTYSSRTLSVSISPNNANYRVEWDSNNTSIVTADSSSPSVTVKSKGKEGTTKVVATVTDLNSGKVYTKSCSVTVEAEDRTSPSTKGGNYNPSLTVTLGSEYTGTSISDSIYYEFHDRYGTWLPSNATVVLSKMNTTYGTLYQSTGFAVRENVDYRFGDLENMTFEPKKVGTWSCYYSVTYSNKTLSGTMSVVVSGSSLNVTLSQTALSLAPYSSQYLYANISPNSAYKVVWSSDNTSVATVAGNGAAATVTTYGKAGTARIRVTVTDRNGYDIVKVCTVTVGNSRDENYSPSISTYIGSNTKGTTIYDALKTQFRSVYNVNLPDTAEITFSNVGDPKVAVRKLQNGTAVKAGTKYTMAQYKGMYTDPVGAGTFTVPYTLTYNKNTLKGNIIVYVNPAPVNVGISLKDSNPYTFSTPLDGLISSSKLCGAVNGVLNNAKEASWSYIRISEPQGNVGTLYLNNGYAPVTNTSNITPEMMDSLYFVPNEAGTYAATLTAHDSKGTVVAMGHLYISVPGSAPNAKGLKVQRTTQTIMVNGKVVDPEGYNINGMNYFKLRAIAYLLDNTSSQFSIDYDYTTRAISIVTGAPYQELNTEMEKGPDLSSTCVYSTIEVYVNGCAMNLTSYNIGGSVYFQLSELGNVLGFNVGYDAATRTVLINSK